jgi:hypothetical protein
MDPPQQVIFHNSRCLFVVSNKGEMKRLYAPIKVKSITPLENMPVNSTLYIEEIQSHNKYLLIYRIFTHWYPYSCFRI